MKLDLAVTGRGAVTPAGVGLEPLRGGTTRPVATPLMGRPDIAAPILRVDLQHPALARWQREPRLRRASPISHFLVEAGDQALRGLPAEARRHTGLVVAFCTGCLQYSRRFFEAIVREGRKAASPALFPETVFNSPVSHVAATLGLEGAAYALAGDEAMWLEALRTAAVWLRHGRLDHVLVLGAEEFDPVVLDAYRRARWMKKEGGSAAGFVPGEGAAGLLVSRPDSATAPAPRLVAAWTGFAYGPRAEALDAARRCRALVDPAAAWLPTAAHHRLRDIERQWFGTGTILPEPAGPYLGEAYAASAAWNTLRALDAAETAPHVALPVWGLHHQFGALEIADPAVPSPGSD